MKEKDSNRPLAPSLEGVPFEDTASLEGQILIAMPQMEDPRFAGSVIYMVAHTEDGAMGLVVNRLVDSLSFPDLLQQLEIDPPGDDRRQIRVHFGGPVETSRGFVLHSSDYLQDATLVVNREIGVTATVEILEAIAHGGGPTHSLLALGYAGWGPGQLEEEIKANGWLTAPASAELIFDSEVDNKWSRALKTLGVDPLALSGSAGNA